MSTELAYFILGATLNLVVALLIVRFIYYPQTQDNTDEMPIREMTYLFIVIALPVMNSIMMSASGLVWLLVANGSIVALLFILEKEWGFHFAGSKRVVYDRVDLITPANQAQLLDDLRQRTGLPVDRVEVRRIDFLHDTAELMVYYDEPRPAKAASPLRMVKQRA